MFKTLKRSENKSFLKLKLKRLRKQVKKYTKVIIANKNIDYNLSIQRGN